MTEVRFGDRHIDPEVLALFVEGRLKRQEIPAVLAHLDVCPICTRAMAGANAQLAKTPKGASSWPRWLAVAAAVIVIAGAGPLLLRRMWLSRPDAAAGRLVALAPASARLAEPRLSGGFAYAPYRGPMRANGGGGEAADRWKLIGVAGELVEQANRAPSPETQHAAGVALVLIEQPEAAMTRLRAAAAGAPRDAKTWSDLAAAEYTAARTLQRPSLYVEAFGAAERALAVDPALPEAWFNRGLILERMGLAREARAAWTRYLQLDPSSRWSEEVRKRLAELPAASSDLLFRQDEPKLESAAERGDAAAVRALVDHDRQRSRTFAEAEYLGQWGEALGQHDEAKASKALATARAVGVALVSLSGESLLHDAVQAIDTADAARRQALAGTHAANRAARVRYSRGAPAAAEPELRRVAREFEIAGSPMGLVAAYYAANTRYDQNDVAGAQSALERLQQALASRPQYVALAAQIDRQLASCSMAMGDWPAGIAQAARAETVFHRLGEPGNEAFAAAMASTTLLNAGKVEEAWAARIRAFAILDQESGGDRLAATVGEAVRTELGGGRTDAARALLHVEESITRAAGNDPLLSQVLAFAAVLDAQTGEDAAAQRNVRDAQSVADRIHDPALRARANANVQFAGGAVALRRDPRGAKVLLTSAIDHYTSTGRSLLVPEAELLRARAALRLGERDDAARDLESGIAALEAHRAEQAGTVVGTGALNAGIALFDEAMVLAAERGDAARAFDYAERARATLTHAAAGARTVTLPELQQRLAGTQTGVLHLRALPDEIVAVWVTAGGASVARHPVSRSVLSGWIEHAFDPGGSATRELYDALLAPTAGALRGIRSLVIVADPLLQRVPYAALTGNAGGSYVVQQLPVALAESASSLAAVPRSAAPRTLAAFSLASDGAAVLNESGGEIADLVALYPNAITIPPERATVAAVLDATAHADVLHLAGHTEVQPSTGDAALIVGKERLSWSGIVPATLQHPVVIVLAACETLRPPRWSDVQPLSIGGGFVAAGAGDVIGTLTPVSDSDAREIFRDIHRRLAAGLAAPEAVREAQLAALSSELSSGRRTAWRSVAVLTRGLRRSGT